MKDTSKANNLTVFLTDLADGIRKVAGMEEDASIDPQDFRNCIEKRMALETAMPSTEALEYTIADYQPGGKEPGPIGFSSVKVPGDSNLTPDNIKDGVIIFGVEGEFGGDDPEPVDRADTTISVEADDTNDKLTITGSNQQPAGYVSDTSAKTASTTVTLTASGATVTATETGGKKVSKSVTTATQATPSITVDEANGLITASATQSAGYVTAGTTSATEQLSTQSATTITPGTTIKTAVEACKYTTGKVEVAGDENLVAGNIRRGKTIFGVVGSFPEIPEGSEGSYTVEFDTALAVGYDFRVTYYTPDMEMITQHYDTSVGDSRPVIEVMKNSAVYIKVSDEELPLFVRGSEQLTWTKTGDHCGYLGVFGDGDAVVTYEQEPEEPEEPSYPYLVLSADPALTADQEITFKWNKVEDANHYDLYCYGYNTEGESDYKEIASGITSTAYSLTPTDRATINNFLSTLNFTQPWGLSAYIEVYAVYGNGETCRSNKLMISIPCATDYYMPNITWSSARSVTISPSMGSESAAEIDGLRTYYYVIHDDEIYTSGTVLLPVLLPDGHTSYTFEVKNLQLNDEIIAHCWAPGHLASSDVYCKLSPSSGGGEIVSN